jgi:hypothetical protein
MSQEHVDKTLDFIAAYNRRDFDAVVEFSTPRSTGSFPRINGRTPAEAETKSNASGTGSTRPSMS